MRLAQHFGYVPADTWEHQVYAFFSQPPPWSAHVMMMFVIILVLILLFRQHRASKALARRRARGRFAMYVAFRLRKSNRMQYLKALLENHIVDGLEDDLHNGLITEAEKTQLYDLLAEGKPRLVGLKPRKTKALSWVARNDLIAQLLKRRAEREKKPERPLPFPDLNKVTITGTGKFADLASRTLKP